MIKIDVVIDNKQWKKYLKNPNKLIKRKISLLNKKDIKLKNNNFMCSLLLSNNRRIKKLNSKYRNKTKSTDVLSFPFYEKKDLKKIMSKKKMIYLGDIIISLDKIKNKKNKSKFIIEFDKLWVHGLLHLFGFKHYKDKDFKKMSSIEKKYLSYIT